jgi:putative lipoic acid-binding regulatory protein
MAVLVIALPWIIIELLILTMVHDPVLSRARVKCGRSVKGRVVCVEVEVKMDDIDKDDDTVQQLRSVHLSEAIDVRYDTAYDIVSF